MAAIVALFKLLVVVNLPAMIDAFWPWDILLDLFCVPFFFLGFCRDDSFGTVYIDFYRTFDETNNIFGFPTKSYHISRARIHEQVSSLNHWFEGRIKFRLGAINDYDIGLLDFDRIPNGRSSCYLLDFDDVSGMFNRNRISALYTTRLPYITTLGETRLLNGCADIDVPLGNSPATMIASNQGALGLPSFVDNNVVAATLAHEIGHVVGFQHTVTDVNDVYSYQDCGLDLKYPSFAADDEGNVLDSSFTLDGVTYTTDEWKPTINAMAGRRFSFSNALRDPFSISLFGTKYEPIFDSMVDCWFEKSQET